MKVLWFNVTEPLRFRQKNDFVGGWQDALESIVSQCDEIKLFVAFVSRDSVQPVTQNRVSYIPIQTSCSFWGKIYSLFSWKTEARKTIVEAKKIIDSVKPDVIHVFGTEWPFGLISKYTSIPVVVHIQGSYVEISKHLYPSGYSFFDELCEIKFNIRHIVKPIFQSFRNKSRCRMEREIWRINKFYMGRTNWDFQLSKKMHLNRVYFHVDEALRPPFINSLVHWRFRESSKTILISTGCSSFWKGPNLLLETAKILKNLNFDFEWRVAGSMPNSLKNIIERKNKTSFEENNVQFIGWQTAEQIRRELVNSNLYIQNSYIENSPNSICEAQILGTPVISTDVGGVPSLIEHEKTGFLVPIDHPEQMAKKIISVAHDKYILCEISKKAQECAIQRHNREKILNQLLDCYNNILNRS